MPDTALLFNTCLGDAAMPGVVDDCRAVLAAVGVEAVSARGTTCCGQPGFNSGHAEQSRAVARTTLRALATTGGPIVVPSGSCAAMIRRHWRELFHGTADAAAAKDVAARTWELSAFLADRREALVAARPAWPGTVAWHDSCHMLRELRLHDEPRAVLGTVQGLQLAAPVEPRCCGFGGSFSVRFPEVSTAMADDRLDALGATGVDAIVSADPGCLLQLGGRSGRVGGTPVLHLATLLAEAVAR